MLLDLPWKRVSVVVATFVSDSHSAQYIDCTNYAMHCWGHVPVKCHWTFRGEELKVVFWRWRGYGKEETEDYEGM